jgi:hypothetical protein
MAFRIARVPLHVTEQVLSSGDAHVAFRAYQPIVWVRLVPWGREPPERAVAFPTVIDSGNNHFFLIPATLFRAWAGVEFEESSRGRTLIVNGFPLKTYGFNLDLFRSREGSPWGRPLARLQMGEGITIIPDSLTAYLPRVPVIGVRTLTVNRLTFTIDGDRQTFSLSQPLLSKAS